MARQSQAVQGGIPTHQRRLGTKTSYNIHRPRLSMHRGHQRIKTFFSLRFPLGLCKRSWAVHGPWSRIHVSYTRVVRLLCGVMTDRLAVGRSGASSSSSRQRVALLDAILLLHETKGVFSLQFF